MELTRPCDKTVGPESLEAEGVTLSTWEFQYRGVGAFAHLGQADIVKQTWRTEADRFMRNILLAISVSILFSAGARTSKGQTKEEKAAKEAPHAATLRKSRVNGPSTTAEHYLLGSFSGSAEALGPNFWGNDPEAVIEALKLSGANKPKSEFETTAQYEARVNTARTANRQRLAFVFRDTSPVRGPKFSYDADNATMNAKLNLERTQFVEVGSINSYYTADVKNIVRSQRKYVGTNGFGAKATISETFIERYGMIFAGLKTFRVGDISLSFPLSTEQAKDLKPNLRFGIICSVEDGRTMYTTDRLEPTISNPYDTIIGKQYLVVLPEQLVVFDERTGNALKTVMWGATDH